MEEAYPIIPEKDTKIGAQCHSTQNKNNFQTSFNSFRKSGENREISDRLKLVLVREQT